MNGHVRSGNDVISRIHEGNAYGNGDEDGGKVTDLALSFDMLIGYTLFHKRNEHLITYKSGDRASQIDFLLYRRRNFREIKNYKEIPGDHVTAHHRLVVIDLSIDVSQKQKRKATTQRRMKRFKLKENDFQQEFKDRFLRELSHDMEDVNTWWNDAHSIILRAGKEILGESCGKKGDIQSCENYQGIKLMSHTLKPLERIFDSQLRQAVRIGRQQLGFMKGIGTVDGTFFLRQTMKKYQKKRVLHMVFIDLEKVNDRRKTGFGSRIYSLISDTKWYRRFGVFISTSSIILTSYDTGEP
ncbi:uncharacterized protein LOC119589706 [Penaeus monodon]|uniref:uncharacterized protein LOC119589706 n=1 Tax=Penaeus monodon TaxID=6687 RepID=UPI0018A7CB26|nr:uncharacterized protein LOC119589706 [Penaeus monodon]